MMIRTLIVDDEPLARERIRSLLGSEPDFEVVGEAANGGEALQELKRRAVDLIFLDIQMPGPNGFEVLRAMDPARLPLVVFVTAFDQHALKAFEVHALDYLLKPFKQSRFKQTLQRIREAAKARAAGAQDASSARLLALLEQLQPRREYLTRFPVRIGERVIFVRVDDIEYMESAGNYVVLHAGKENHVVRETLSSLEDSLDPKRFIRINRSTIVRLDQVKEIQPLFKGEHALILQNGKQLPMTRGVREVQEALKFS